MLPGMLGDIASLGVTFTLSPSYPGNIIIILQVHVTVHNTAMNRDYPSLHVSNDCIHVFC